MSQIGDVNLTLREKPHPTFSRSGNDLVHVARVSLLAALCGTTILVPTLDRRTLPIAITDIIRYANNPPHACYPLIHIIWDQLIIICSADVMV